MKELGQIAYEAYLGKLNGVPWRRLSTVERDAWQAAALAVAQEVKNR